MKNAKLALMVAASLAIGGGLPAAADGGQTANQDRSSADKVPGTEQSSRRQVLQVPVWEVTAGDLAAEPAQYYGRIVSVTAEVERLVGPRSFTLDEDRLGAGPDVLVIVPQTVAGIGDGDTARVVGTERPLITTELGHAANGAAGEGLTRRRWRGPSPLAAFQGGGLARRPRRLGEAISTGSASGGSERSRPSCGAAPSWSPLRWSSTTRS